MADEAKQSTFVTVTAWLAMIFSGFAAATGLLQSALVVAMPFEPMSATEAAEIPPLMRFLFDHFQAFVLSHAAFWAIAFACALGLLRRREWARQGFIAVLLVLAIGAASVGVVQQAMMNEMFAGTGDAADKAKSMILIMRIASGVFSLVFAGAISWVAFQLLSPRIRAEFSAL